MDVGGQQYGVQLGTSGVVAFQVECGRLRPLRGFGVEAHDAAVVGIDLYAALRRFGMI
jgi:hypothetical protein